MRAAASAPLATTAALPPPSTQRGVAHAAGLQPQPHHHGQPMAVHDQHQARGAGGSCSKARPRRGTGRVHGPEGGVLAPVSVAEALLRGGAATTHVAPGPHADVIAPAIMSAPINAQPLPPARLLSLYSVMATTILPAFFGMNLRAPLEEESTTHFYGVRRARVCVQCTEREARAGRACAAALLRSRTPPGRSRGYTHARRRRATARRSWARASRWPCCRSPLRAGPTSSTGSA